MTTTLSKSRTATRVTPGDPSRPRVFNVLAGQASEIHDSPYGSVGVVFSGDGIEAEWISKQNEEKDPNWFSQRNVDLILVLQGMLRIEFADPSFETLDLKPGDVLVVPPKTRCRAYHWPPEANQATIFFATYPKEVHDPGMFTLHRWCTSG